MLDMYTLMNPNSFFLVRHGFFFTPGQAGERQWAEY